MEYSFQMVLLKYLVNSLFISSVFFFAGCSDTMQLLQLQKQQPSSLTIEDVTYDTEDIYTVKTSQDINKTIQPSLTKEQLYAKLLQKEYRKWKGVKYCYGGTSHKGVDCSSLIQQVYKSAFNYPLPRTTYYQIKQGVHVEKKDLFPGDLIFFKTEPRTMHIGVYIQDGKFMHASSSKGVWISTIHNPYWRAHYYTARRVLP